MIIPFYKYHGSGNDFVIIDNIRNKFKFQGFLRQAIIAGACHRKYGIGADGLILLQPEKEVDFRMLYFNADGKEGSLCGNGSRCAVAFASHTGIITDTNTRFSAVDGIHKAVINKAVQNNFQVAVQLADSPIPKHLRPGEYFIDTGSPHLVIFNDHLWEIDVGMAGREIRHSAPWAVDGVNVNFVKIIDRQTLAIRTYERGVEEETYSCGTGATAAALSAWIYNKNSKTNKLFRIKTYGGTLEVSFEPPNKTNNAFSNIWLNGPAQFVFEGTVEL